MADFHSLLEQGKLTEIKIAKWLEANGLRVEDVSDDKRYRKRDIDLKVYDKKGIPFTMEIKSDEIQSRTQNLFIEKGMERRNGWKNGWFFYCEANVLCFHDNVNDVGQFYDWKKIKSEIEELSRNMNSSCRLIRFWNVTDNCYGKAWVVSLEEVRTLNWIILEYDLRKSIDKQRDM